MDAIDAVAQNICKNYIRVVEENPETTISHRDDVRLMIAKQIRNAVKMAGYVKE